ncbi:HAD-IA family hydrolase [Iamia majanohamensis]|uniref:HAD-IA family hydrolase n=1 Tax=Iamia majanohamensis TaxID=467976 RepID=A0AAE9YCW2_9ACTN|nr:HAD-IA family hydrolase [Iamia majanohamensis]WCO65471.1 HAD-IA family hydrolase [Iamia majanohamensis]
MIRAALFDFGGVILSSPFEAFARYEAENGLPDGFLRRVNATDPDTNAWARLERNEVDLEEFGRLFEAEARALGGEVVAADVLGLLRGDVRPAMVEAVRRCAERLRTALLTNNVVSMQATEMAGGRSPAAAGEPDPGAVEDGADRDPRVAVLDLFDVIIESSVVGVRKPDPAFYERACAELGIDASEAVFLDDLGVNLKPARAMGMTTIKVDDPDEAITALESVVGFPLR